MKLAFNTGAQQALQWLFEHENDPEAGMPLPNEASATIRVQQNVPIVGVAGILKREEELAARNDRYLNSELLQMQAVAVYSCSVPPNKALPPES